jgi:hypothetical protein
MLGEQRNRSRSVCWQDLVRKPKCEWSSGSRKWKQGQEQKREAGLYVVTRRVCWSVAAEYKRVSAGDASPSIKRVFHRSVICAYVTASGDGPTTRGSSKKKGHTGCAGSELTSAQPSVRASVSSVFGVQCSEFSVQRRVGCLTDRDNGGVDGWIAGQTKGC